VVVVVVGAGVWVVVGLTVVNLMVLYHDEAVVVGEVAVVGVWVGADGIL